jgi:hypothetical protein
MLAEASDLLQKIQKEQLTTKTSAISELWNI